jgi:phosphotransferase system  glucose/maltose/N-acetylglucosamine-specific IIC component
MDLTLINGLSRVEANERTIQGLNRYTPTIAEQEAIGILGLGRKAKERRQERRESKFEQKLAKKEAKTELKRAKADAKILIAEGKRYRGMAKQTKAESGEDGFKPVELMTRAATPELTEINFFDKNKILLTVLGLAGAGTIVYLATKPKNKKKK